jgi:predicted nucleotidyltransferase component of viral defense system
MKNVAASVRDRLKNLARERHEDFQLVLTRYANERLLYRLTVSSHGPRFVLKGAALFTLWTGAPHRPSRDLDLLGSGDSSEAHMRDVFAAVVAIDIEDGVVFHANTLRAGPIREEQAYGGVRVTVDASIAGARIPLQVDIGFGDAITPDAQLVAFPALLNFAAPQIRAYPRETVVAEKLEAMVQLGLANSRMKDFYDVVVLSKRFAFEGDLLVRALRATFERRRTALPNIPPTALTLTFADDANKRSQWGGFVRKSGAQDADDLPTTVATIARFLVEPLMQAASSRSWAAKWPAGGPWSI